MVRSELKCAAAYCAVNIGELQSPSSSPYSPYSSIDQQSKGTKESIDRLYGVRERTPSCGSRSASARLTPGVASERSWGQTSLSNRTTEPWNTSSGISGGFLPHY